MITQSKASSSIRIVITQNQLIKYAGSEIVTLELASYLAKNGYEVLILTNSLGEPMVNEFKKIANVKLFVNPSSEFDKEILRKPADIAWIHHQLVPRSLTTKRALSHTKYIFHHMSPYHPTEFPVFADIEEQLADIILFNSQETMHGVLEQGLFGSIKKSKLDVFGNPAPDDFRSVNRNHRHKLRNLLIVTNHLTEELRGIKEALQEQGVETTIFGSNGDSYQRITPNSFNNFDAVITIGKTVQYALLAQLPVYCYDHFGGPGYLDNDNFSESRERNFSGRNGGKRNLKEIVNELIVNYSKAIVFSKNVPQDVINSLTLSYQLEHVFKKVDHNHENAHKLQIEEDKLIGLQKVNELNRIIQEILRTYDSESNTYSQKIKELLVNIENQQLKVSDLESKHESVISSRDYRIGKNILLPIRKVKRLLGR